MFWYVLVAVIRSRDEPDHSEISGDAEVIQTANTQEIAEVTHAITNNPQ